MASAQLRASIAYILIRDGEATPRQLSDKLAVNTTDVAVALKEMYDANDVTREPYWDGSGGVRAKTFIYAHRNADSVALTGKPPSAIEMARYVWLNGKQVGRLTDVMFQQVQRHGQSGEKTLRMFGPDPATLQQRQAARQQGMALPTRQHITLDIVEFKQPPDQTYYGLLVSNHRTLNALLDWHPEFRTGN